MTVQTERLGIVALFKCAVLQTLASAAILLRDCPVRLLTVPRLSAFLYHMWPIRSARPPRSFGNGGLPTSSLTGGGAADSSDPAWLAQELDAPQVHSF